MMNIQQVEHMRQRVIDHLFDRWRAMVESRQWRENDATHFSDGGHVSQMSEIERRFTRHQDQAAPFFQHDVGSARDHRKDAPAEGAPHVILTGKVVCGSVDIRGPRKGWRVGRFT